MQAGVLAEPELDPLGHESVAAPVRRSWHGLIVKARFGFGDACLQHVTRRDHLALCRRLGADLAAARASRKVAIRPLGRRALDPAFDAHLTVQARPEKDQSGVRVEL